MRRENSLFRQDLTANDFVEGSGGEDCAESLEVGNGITHYCTRPQGHDGQHYSFRNGAISYEIVWPATS